MSHNHLSQRVIQWAPAVLIVLMVGLYAWSFVYSVLVLDSSRDLYRATQISQLKYFPTLGPDIGGLFHTGPLWFYLLAIPAWFGSLKLVAFCVGILAGLKFVFAYQLGGELINRRFGLIWAFMLLIPGWHFLSQVFINHTNLLEALSLLLLLMLYRMYQSGDSRYGLLSALVLGLGFQAHPGFLVLLVFYLPLIWSKKINYKFSHLLAAAVLFLLPLLPYLIDQMINGFPDWTRFLQHDSLQNQIKASGSGLITGNNVVLHWWQNLEAVLFGGPLRIITFVSVASAQMGVLLGWLFGLVGCTSLLGIGWILLGLTQHRKLMMSMIMMLLCAMFLLTLLRDFTPFYMLLPLTALFHGVLGLGLYQVFSQLTQAWNYLLFLLFMLMGFLPLWALQKTSVNHQVNFGPVMNVNTELAKDWVNQQDTLDLLSINESKSIASVFCDQVVVLNGPFSVVLDVTAAAPLHYFCEDFALILGGKSQQGSKSVYMMHKSFWKQIEQEPENWISASWGLTTRYQNHGPVQGLRPVVFDDYIHPPRSNHKVKPVKTHQLELVAKQFGPLSISNMLPFNVQFRVDKITANNLPVELVMANAANRLYHCTECQNEPVTWRLSLTSNDINVIDINSLQP